MAFRRRVVIVSAAVIGLAAVLAAHAYRFKDDFVFLTVEESSASALAGLPVGWEKLPRAFIDCEAKIIELDRRPRLIGVSLCVHLSSSSQGIEFREHLGFSRTGRAFLRVAEPVSVKGRDWSGGEVEMVDNGARIVRGDLVVEKTEASGVVHLKYGGKRFSLAPGQSWAELLTVSAASVREIPPESWEAETEACFASGTPVTRLAIANRGFWPKANVRRFPFCLRGGVVQ